MTQILPKIQDIKFSTSSNVYKKSESKESTNLFEAKKEGAVIAFVHAILNKLFGEKTITQSNIEIITSCAIKNIDKMELTAEHLIEARKITNQMQEIAPDSKIIKKLQKKIDTKIINLSKKNFDKVANFSFTPSKIKEKVSKDFPRATNCFFNGQPLQNIVKKEDYHTGFKNCSVETKALLLANCQEFEVQRNAVAYGFNLNFFDKEEKKINTELKREYSIKQCDAKSITVHVKTSWDLDNKSLITVDSEITFDTSKMTEIFNDDSSSEQIIDPTIHNNVTSSQILDSRLLDRSIIF